MNSFVCYELLERLTTTSIQTHETESRLYYKEKSEEKMWQLRKQNIRHTQAVTLVWLWQRCGGIGERSAGS